MAQPKIKINALDTTIAQAPAVASSYLFGQNVSTTTGLTLGYYGGIMAVDGVLTTIANGTVGPLTASQTNYVEATRSGAVSFNTTGFTPGRIPMFVVVTGVSTITTITDQRVGINGMGNVGRLNLSVAGNSNVTLTAAQARNQILNFTGVLTGNINIIVPDGPQQWTVSNNTTGAFTITVKTSAGGGVIVAQGTTVPVISDGTNVASLGAAALSNFTESIIVTSPNESTPVARLLATNAAANVDVAISPKGSGALVASAPDGTLTGGNKRGTSAVDLQMFRNVGSHVASGPYSTISGGIRNMASGQASVVAGGSDNTASGTSSFAVGDQSTASSSYAIVMGQLCTASGANSVTIGTSSSATALGAASIGYGTQANGNYSLAMGMYSSTRGVTGAFAYASGSPASAGDTQRREMILRATTTDGTATTLTTTGTAASISNCVNVGTTGAYLVKGLAVARQQSTGDTKSWEFVAHIRFDINSDIADMVAACTPVVVAATAGASAWTLTVDADNTNNLLRVQGTGETGKTLRWVCRVISVEVIS